MLLKISIEIGVTSSFLTKRHFKLTGTKNSTYTDPKIVDMTRYLQANQRSGRISAGVWGWISEAGPGEMCLIGGRLNSPKYIEILEEVLIPSLDISYRNANMIFMQVRFC